MPLATESLGGGRVRGIQTPIWVKPTFLCGLLPISMGLGPHPIFYNFNSFRSVSREPSQNFANRFGCHHSIPCQSEAFDVENQVICSELIERCPLHSCSHHMSNSARTLSINTGHRFAMVRGPAPARLMAIAQRSKNRFAPLTNGVNTALDRPQPLLCFPSLSTKFLQPFDQYVCPLTHHLPQ